MVQRLVLPKGVRGLFRTRCVELIRGGEIEEGDHLDLKSVQVENADGE